MAYIRMHRISKIDWRRTVRQLNNAALRRKHVDFGGKQIHLNVFHKLGRIIRLGLQLFELFNPASGGISGVRTFTFPVSPMRGHTRIGDLVHLARADLNLNRYAGIVYQHRMQRLVTVRFGHSDIVFKSACLGFVHLM